MTEIPAADSASLWNGRFAPSPTGDLHVGNLRTALIAWLVARSHGAQFVIRMEDLDPMVSRREHADSQLRDLASIGLDWDGEVVFQSDRHELYAAALDHLRAEGLVYECFCTRKEIQAASQAPNGPQLEGRYPGTCRELCGADQLQRARDGRPPALRLHAGVESGDVSDLFAGTHTFPVDDLVLRRNDGTWAYNLAVVVDDAAQGIGTVVRGDDLLPSTPRQMHLAGLLGLPLMQYVHIPLVVAETGERLSKQDGAVTMRDLERNGQPVSTMFAELARSLDLDPTAVPIPEQLIAAFDLTQVPRQPWKTSS
jgi:glutamyl-tRNA synthetase